ncbi:MAG: hypothetical protein Q9162_004789 [Coniocarpon cinnabarinum]
MAASDTGPTVSKMKDFKMAYRIVVSDIYGIRTFSKPKQKLLNHENTSMIFYDLAEANAAAVNMTRSAVKEEFEDWFDVKVWSRKSCESSAFNTEVRCSEFQGKYIVRYDGDLCVEVKDIHVVQEFPGTRSVEAQAGGKFPATPIKGEAVHGREDATPEQTNDAQEV